MTSEKKVDEAWKNKVRKEKQELSEKKEDDTSINSVVAESTFAALLQSIGQQFSMSLQTNNIDQAKQAALVIFVLDEKTKEKQTKGEKSAFAQIKMQLEELGFGLKDILEGAKIQ